MLAQGRPANNMRTKEGKEPMAICTAVALPRSELARSATTGNRGSFQRHRDWGSFGVASGHATLATKRTLLLTWAGLAPAGSHQLSAGAPIR